MVLRFGPGVDRHRLIQKFKPMRFGPITFYQPLNLVIISSKKKNSCYYYLTWIIMYKCKSNSTIAHDRIQWRMVCFWHICIIWPLKGSAKTKYWSLNKRTLPAAITEIVSTILVNKDTIVKLYGDVFVVLNVWLWLLLMIIKSITKDKWMALNKHRALSPLGESDLPAWVNLDREPASFSWFLTIVYL